MKQISKYVESQFNGQESTAAHACLLAANIQASIDGHGRALDNVSCERLSRSVKSENISLNQYDLARQLQTDLTAYFDFYNHERPHPPKCTLFFPFRGPNIGTHHTITHDHELLLSLPRQRRIHPADPPILIFAWIVTSSTPWRRRRHLWKKLKQLLSAEDHHKP